MVSRAVNAVVCGSGRGGVPMFVRVVIGRCGLACGAAGAGGAAWTPMRRGASSSARSSPTTASTAPAAPAASRATARSPAPSRFAATGRCGSCSCRPARCKVKGEAVCASVRGMPFEPCFNLDRTDAQSFRGSVSGLAASPIAISPAAMPRPPSVRAHGASHLAAAGDPGGRAAVRRTDARCNRRAHPLGAAPVSGAVAFRAGNSRRW